MNFLPFLELSHPDTNKSVKLLIDTGANKNVIKPGLLKNPKPVNDISIKNISGSNNVTKKGYINFFNGSFKPFPFYELRFHKFFDGILGSETLAKLNGKLDYVTETLCLDNKRIKFQKYFPSIKMYNSTISIDTTGNGDWFVPTYQKLHKNTFIQPGLYRSQNMKSAVNILTTHKKTPDIPKIDILVNNFETISPIPIIGKNSITKEEILHLIRTDHLSQWEKDSIIQTLHENQRVLLRQNEKLSSMTTVKHKIHTSDDAPVYTKSYRYPHHFKQDVHEQIQEMLENGIIQNSRSPYSSPIWVVPKKTDASGKRKVRVVIDYRKLNDKTIDDKYPMPQIEEILDNLGKSTYFTTLDLKSGFHQIEMDPAHREKTAFSTDKGHFEFTRMPFGLKNAPATFQRAMNNILCDYIGKICYVYLDDIIIVGYNLENHMDNLKTVLKRLCEFNLKIQLDKCEFLKRETEFLGHIISCDGVKPNPEKIEKILSWPIPKNEKQIKQFLGLVGYYRRFIKNFSQITRPMTKYLKKGIPISLQDPAYLNAFTTLKQVISTDQILAYPHFDKPFILTTDASDTALGAVLSQIQDKIEKPIAFASRTLNDTESRYATNEKEALAIIWAVNKFKPYLYGTKFTLITDHKPLTFIKSSDKNAKILRWRLDLENYDYEVKYREGKTNVVADALSRRPEEINVNEFDNNMISPIPGPSFEPGYDAASIQNQPPMSTNHDHSDTDTIHSANDSDDYYIHFSERPVNYYRNQLIFRHANIGTVIQETLFGNFKRTIIVQQNYDKKDVTQYLKTYHNGKQTAIMAPENLMQTIQDAFKEHFGTKGHFVFTSHMVEDVQNEDHQNFIISKEHDRAHRGISEVDSQIRRAYFFPRITQLVRNHINKCNTCNIHKYDRKPYNIKLSPRPITDKPMERVHMDIFIIAKVNFLSLIDSFTKHLQMFHIKSKNLTHVQKALGKYFSSFGVPNSIVTDHETTFRSIQTQNFLDALGCSLQYASSSESNGQVERAHSTVIEIYNSNKHKFASMGTKSLIKLAVALYNDSIHSSTGFTPNEIIFNRNNINNPEEIIGNAQKIFTEARSKMLKSQTNQIKQNHSKEDPPQLEDEQEVFVIPQIRTKTQPRACKTKVYSVTDKTFKNNRHTKRHKNKIKRIKKITNN